MLRRAAIVILALAVNPALVRAQETVLTVSVPSADIYKGPSTITPIIGHVSRGAVLPVSRNLGSWVKVPWPDAQDGVGYVHVTMGFVGPANGVAPAATTQRGPSAGRPTTTSIPPLTRTSVGERVVPSGQLNVAPPASHVFGLGALVGSPQTFGATVRAWQRSRLGVQLGFSREAMTSDLAAGQVTTVQFEPAIVYGVLDHVTDYVWIRPYLGSAASIRHESLSIAAPVAEPASQTGVGFRVFGGAEFTFASAPRFGVSADAGYRHYPTPYPGFDASPLSLAVAGHWYVK